MCSQRCQGICGIVQHMQLHDRGVPIAAVDWRLYSQSHQLTDKQEKLADKIRRQELKIHNLRTETDRIRVSKCC